MKWSICLPSYNNFSEVFFTIQSLRLHHDMKDKEIVVVDNYGDDYMAEFIKKRGGNTVRYERMREVRGVSAAKNAAIKAARGEFVLCMDSHILLKQGCFDVEPCGDDLIQGPILFNNCIDYITEWKSLWRSNMWGIWGEKIPFEQLPKEKKEIWAMGAGFFACRRASWLGFNEKFRGFGGETGYIQEKYRKAGRKVWCYPNMIWLHYFCNTGRRIPFPVIMAERVRNYLIGFNELGLDITPILQHFGERLVKEARAMDLKGGRYNP